MVWQSRFVGTKSPRTACAGSSPAASARNHCRFPIGNFQLVPLCRRFSEKFKSALGKWQSQMFWTCSSSEIRARPCEGRGRTFKSCQVQSWEHHRLSLCHFHVGCSSMAERLAVNEETTSSILASRPNLFPELWPRGEAPDCRSGR